MQARKALIPILFILIWSFSSANAGPRTLTPVGNPIKGKAPFAVDTVETLNGTFAVIGENQGNKVRSYAVDRATGALISVDTQKLLKGASDLKFIVGPRRLLAISNLKSDNVDVLSLDDAGKLIPVSDAPSGGKGPIALDVMDEGFAMVANRDTENMVVIKVDPVTGAMSIVNNIPLAPAPRAVKTTGQKVIVGHDSGILGIFKVDRASGAIILTHVENVGAQVTSMDIKAKRLAVGTFEGDVFIYKITKLSLKLLKKNSIGSSIVTDVSFSDKKTLFVTDVNPGRVAAFDLAKNGKLKLSGELQLTGQSSRALATVPGENKKDTFVIINEFSNNRTLVVKASEP